MFEIEPGNTVVVPLNFYSYPISHSLVAAVGWSFALGLIYFAFSRYKRSVDSGALCFQPLDS
jgi:hypothetical protein